MKNNNLISIIVPVYNVERYLKRCINSILNQTYKDYEVLLIDDGSTDLSGKICDESSMMDERIIVYHKENGGLSDARNYGLCKAKGKYVTFIDSDDYIGPQFLEILYEGCEKHGAMMSVGTSTFSYNETLDYFNEQSDNIFECYTTEAALRQICLNAKFGMATWGKLYDKRLFENIQFPVGKLYEDLQTTPYLIDQCKQVIYCKAATYYWYQRQGSIMHSYSSKNNIWYDSAEQFVEFVSGKYPDLYEFAICRYVNDSFWTIVQRIALTENCYKSIAYAKKRCLRYWKEGIKNKYLGVRKKINIFIIVASPRLYVLIYRFYWKYIKINSY